MVALCNTLLLTPFEGSTEMYAKRYSPRSKSQPEKPLQHILTVIGVVDI